MISGPAKWLLGNPRPTSISISPPAVRVWAPVTALSFARLPDVTVVVRLTPGTVRLKLAIKCVIGTRLCAINRRNARLTARRCPCRCRGRRSVSLGGRSRFFLRKRFFAGIKFGLLLSKTLLLSGLAFRGQPLLDLSLNLCVSLRFTLRFTACNQDCESKDNEEEARKFHCLIRPGRSLLIRSKAATGRHNTGSGRTALPISLLPLSGYDRRSTRGR